ncbi:talin-2-like [Paramuricea clavata]|uniref:Talin-2-like, partial n=1 Tax=Paramuricea clavata TaxID=317549 RepID=A0A6S7GWW9_PARCT|nr:talin-2-like [Paramuricea clavata]
MAALSLKVNLVKQKTIKTLQFEPTILVQDALRIIDEKVPQATEGERTNYGLFLEEENERGRWLEPSRPLNFYPLASGKRYS